ncbi:ATP5C1 [Bugula neritina]|uniref:ATP synthase subunit gamma n=1 Tax=Bugula neritina TaxID=10212 RepID=A0A7J7J1W1_BUGNE|nr:ATP5C1 [Bugula neritina]
MLKKAVPVFQPQSCQTRNMATLKDIATRLKSVKNIQKITKSMKMVSAAKFAKAERELKPARVYGAGATAFYDKLEVESDESKPNHLIVAISSDKGLCGGVHSAICKAIKAEVSTKSAEANIKLVAVGDKARAILARTHKDNFMLSCKEIGRLPPTFADASSVAQDILDSGYEYDNGSLFFNTFKSVVSYNVTKLPLLSINTVSAADNLALYDSVDEDVLTSYNEFALASLVFFGMKEGAASEQSARMTAMDGASKNAGEMIDKLTLTYNRTRQAVITRELIEIISGASALD